MIGLDIGTSTTKSVIFNRQGEVVSEFECAYSTYHPKPGYYEQNPLEIDKAARLAIATSIPKQYSCRRHYWPKYFFSHA